MDNWCSGRRAAAVRRLFMAMPLAVAGCAITSPSVQDEQAMQSLGAALTKLTSAVDVTVAYEELPQDISERRLLQRSTQHDPALLTPFDGYAVRVLNADGHVVLLVCTDDRRRGLLEDAACTPRLDRHAWREAGAVCEFSLADKRSCDQ